MNHIYEHETANIGLTNNVRNRSDAGIKINNKRCILAIFITVADEDVTLPKSTTAASYSSVEMLASRAILTKVQ